MATSAAATLPPDEIKNRPGLIASFWTLYPITVFLLVGRFYVRYKRGRIGWDDWFMLFGWMLYTVGITVLCVAALNGAGRHLVYLLPDPPHLSWLLLLINVAQFFVYWSLTFTKTSVALLLPRILRGTDRWRTMFLTSHIVIYFCLAIVTTGLTWGQCSPAQALWHPELLAEGATCDLKYASYGVSLTHLAFGAYLDFALALMPVSIVYKLQRPLRFKIGICVLLGLGIIAGAFAIVKATQFWVEFDVVDPTYDSYGLQLWASLELPFVIIAGSIPPNRPLWNFFFYGKPIVDDDSGKGKSGWDMWIYLHSLRSRWSSGRSGRRNADPEDSGPLNEHEDSIVMKRVVDVEHTAIDQSTSAQRKFPSDARWATRSDEAV